MRSKGARGSGDGWGAGAVLTPAQRVPLDGRPLGAVPRLAPIWAAGRAQKRNHGERGHERTTCDGAIGERTGGTRSGGETPGGQRSSHAAYSAGDSGRRRPPAFVRFSTAAPKARTASPAARSEHWSLSRRTRARSQAIRDRRPSSASRRAPADEEQGDGGDSGPECEIALPAPVADGFALPDRRPTPDAVSRERQDLNGHRCRRGSPHTTGLQ